MDRFPYDPSKETHVAPSFMSCCVEESFSINKPSRPRGPRGTLKLKRISNEYLSLYHNSRLLTEIRRSLRKNQVTHVPGNNFVWD